MDIALWVLQWLLAAVFLVVGAVKAFVPPEKLLANPRMGWIADTGIRQARQAGYAEIIGAAGLVLPGLTEVPGYLTIAAALGLMIIQVMAAGTVHRPRGEPITQNVVLGVLLLVLVVGRLLEPL